MTELLNSEITGPPTLPDPISGQPLWPNKYIAACLDITQNPSPFPDQPSTAELSSPVVQDLIAADGWYRQALIETLQESYNTTQPDAAADGEMNRNLASRNFVSDVIWRAQRWALDHDDQNLSAQMIDLTCTLINKDFENGSARRVDHLLVYSLQSAVTKIMSNSLASDLESKQWMPENSESELFEILISLLMIDKIDLRKRSTINFILTRFGFDPKQMLAAWQNGFNNDQRSYTEDLHEDVIDRNVKQIIFIEAAEPGCARRLNQERKIKCFARLSPEVLLYLDSNKSKIGEAAAIFTATYDYNDAFERPDDFFRLLNEIVSSGHVLEYYECDSKESMKECEKRLRERRPQIHSILRLAHSAAELMRLNAGSAEGSCYAAEDLLNDSGWVSKFHEGVKSIALMGCSLGKHGKFADVLAHIVRGGIRISGISLAASANVKYTRKNGFELFDVIPTEIPKKRLVKRIFDRILASVNGEPVITVRRRYSDEEEEFRHLDSVERISQW